MINIGIDICIVGKPLLWEASLLVYLMSGGLVNHVYPSKWFNRNSLLASKPSRYAIS